MKLLFLGLLITMCVFSGCSTTNWFEGTRTGSGQAEFSADLLECQAVAVRLCGYAEPNTMKTCMQSKNWKMTKP